jgi:hypothetical protein
LAKKGHRCRGFKNGFVFQFLCLCLKNLKLLNYIVYFALLQTRGFKVIVKMMPHEVADLEPVLGLLVKQNKDSCQVK